MGTITVYPGKVSGIAAAPYAKRDVRRAIIAAAAAKCGVRGVDASQDELLSRLESMGAAYRRSGDTVSFYAPPQIEGAKAQIAVQTLHHLLPLINSEDADVKRAENTLRRFGFEADDSGAVTGHTPRGQDFVYTPSADYRAAAYLLLCGTVSGDVGVTGLIAEDSPEDKRIMAQLALLGVPLREMNGASFAKSARVKPQDIDARDIADVLPAALLLGALSRGRCGINHAASLHTKQRDEMDVAVRALKAIGADMTEIGGDAAAMGKRTLMGGRADADGSEPAAMMLCAAALCCEMPVTIESAPDMTAFIRALRALGASVS